MSTLQQFAKKIQRTYKHGEQIPYSYEQLLTDLFHSTDITDPRANYHFLFVLQDYTNKKTYDETRGSNSLHPAENSFSAFFLEYTKTINFYLIITQKF